MSRPDEIWSKYLFINRGVAPLRRPGPCTSATLRLRSGRALSGREVEGQGKSGLPSLQGKPRLSRI